MEYADQAERGLLQWAIYWMRKMIYVFTSRETPSRSVKDEPDACGFGKEIHVGSGLCWIQYLSPNYILHLPQKMWGITAGTTSYWHPHH